MNTVVFEDEGWEKIVPISLTRHLSQALLGTSTVLDQISGTFGGTVSLAGRDAIAEVAKEETGLEFSTQDDGDVLLVNARLNPTSGLPLRKFSGRKRFVLSDHRGSIAVASLPRRSYEEALSRGGVLSQRELEKLSRGLERLSSSDPLLFEYPWEMISANDRAILQSQARKKTEGAPKVVLAASAEVEESVSFDTRLGPVVVDEGARIESFSRIAGPCYIGKDTVLHSALLRPGTTISSNCRVGGEVERSIIYPYSNKAHFGFLGHSIVGSWVNMGAGSVTSDLKSTYGTIKVVRGERRVDTGMLKLGTIAGDMAKVASGTMINAGRTVGISSQVSGTLGEDVSDFLRFDGTNPGEALRLDLDSVLETQSRMMSRRGAKMTGARRRMIRALYAKRSRPDS